MKLPSGFLSQFLLVFLFASCGMAAFAQTAKIKGRVTMEGEAVPFITVILTNSQNQILQGCETDEDGNFELKDILPGGYILLAKNYEAKTQQQVLISPGECLIVDLEMDRLRSLCLCAPPMALSVESPRKVLTQVMSDRNPYSLVAALNGGIYQRDLGETAQSRGARPTATAVYVDGVKLRGELELPFAALRSVDLIQGGVPAEYGDATGGIIDIKTLGPIGGGMPRRNGAYGDSWIQYPYGAIPIW